MRPSPRTIKKVTSSPILTHNRHLKLVRNVSMSMQGMKGSSKRPMVVNLGSPEEGTTMSNSMDVLTLMGELKQELRVETERMNSKMGVVEAQMRIILKLLRKQKSNVDVEAGIRLEELMQDDETSESRNETSKSVRASASTNPRVSVKPTSTTRPTENDELGDLLETITL